MYLSLSHTPIWALHWHIPIHGHGCHWCPYIGMAANKTVSYKTWFDSFNLSEYMSLLNALYFVKIKHIPLRWSCLTFQKKKKNVSILKGLMVLEVGISHTHNCHMLRTEICKVRAVFKGALIKFYGIFTKITLKLPENSQNLFFLMFVINTTKCDFFIKCVIRCSENSVRFEILTGIGVQTGQILWDFISQCEIWHVWINPESPSHIYY